MTQPSRPSSGTLTSWKEIATFFNREVRTVQLWEKEEGLPVHRHLHRRQASVYAYPAELEKWWKQRVAKDPEAEASPPPAHGAESLQLPETSPDPALETIAPVPAKRAATGVWLGAAAVVLLLAAGAALIQMQKGTITSEPQVGRLVRVTADARAMQAIRGAQGVADWNGDGLGDFLFTAEPQMTRLHIHFGRKESGPEVRIGEAADVVILGSGRGSLSHHSADVNGDGLRDLIVAEVLNEPYSFTGTGSVHVFWGRRIWPASLQLTDADVTIRIDATNDARLTVCPALGGAVDLNGDGLEDLLLMGHEYTEGDRRSAGGVFVLHGRRHWPKKMEVLADADIRFVGARTGEGLAGAACEAGDFNGDGRADLAVHASGATLWEMRGRRTRAYLFFGRANWPPRIDAATDFDLRIESDHAVRKETLALADINGDGTDDFVWFHTRDRDHSGNSQRGEIMAWFGQPGRRGALSENAADLRIATEWPDSNWDATMQVADLDLDGMGDILLSIPSYGRVTLLYGRKDWKPRADLAEYSPVSVFHGEPGTPVWRAWVEDMDGDLLPEIVVWSAPDSPAQRQALGWIVTPHLTLDLDVRPTHEPNIVYLPDGVLVARIRGKARAVTDELDPATVRLAGAPATEQVQRDFDGDGVEDLQLHFETSALRVTPETTRIALTARTRSGLPAAGTDSVQVVVKRAAGHSSTGPSPD